MGFVKEYISKTNNTIQWTGNVTGSDNGIATNSDGAVFGYPGLTVMTLHQTPSSEYMQPGAVVTITNSPKLNGSWVIRLQGLFSDSTYLLNKPFVETTEEEKDAAFWTGTGIVDLAVESKEASGLNVESNIITSAALSSSWNGTSMKFNNTALWNTDYGNVLRKES
tara:strand:- start:12111 stop:12608 length:498 start_codon:yes stop_codon:yes gene_type:complete